MSKRKTEPKARKPRESRLTVSVTYAPDPRRMKEAILIMLGVSDRMERARILAATEATLATEKVA